MSQEQIDITQHDEKSLEWVQLMKDIHPKETQIESFYEKTVRKFKENPLVPIGCLVTSGFLTYGLVNMVRGDSLKQQKMMRGRVMAQGFTVGAIVVGLLWFNQNQKNQK